MDNDTPAQGGAQPQPVNLDPYTQYRHLIEPERLHWLINQSYYQVDPPEEPLFGAWAKMVDIYKKRIAWVARQLAAVHAEAQTRNIEIALTHAAQVICPVCAAGRFPGYYGLQGWSHINNGGMPERCSASNIHELRTLYKLGKLEEVTTLKDRVLF